MNCKKLLRMMLLILFYSSFFPLSAQQERFLLFSAEMPLFSDMYFSEIPDDFSDYRHMTSYPLSHIGAAAGFFYNKNNAVTVSVRLCTNQLAFSTNVPFLESDETADIPVCYSAYAAVNNEYYLNKYIQVSAGIGFQKTVLGISQYTGNQVKDTFDYSSFGIVLPLQITCLFITVMYTPCILRFTDNSINAGYSHVLSVGVKANAVFNKKRSM